MKALHLITCLATASALVSPAQSQVGGFPSLPAPTSAKAEPIDAGDFGLLPKQRRAIRVQPGWRNPFSERPKDTASASGTDGVDTDSMQTRLKTFFQGLKITGITNVGPKKAALAGSIPLIEGEIVEQVFGDQTEMLRVIKIDDRWVKLSFVEDKTKDYTQARDINIPVPKKGLVRMKLVGGNETSGKSAAGGGGELTARFPKRDPIALARAVASATATPQPSTNDIVDPAEQIGQLPAAQEAAEAMANVGTQSGSGAIPAQPAYPLDGPTQPAANNAVPPPVPNPNTPAPTTAPAEPGSMVPPAPETHPNPAAPPHAPFKSASTAPSAPPPLPVPVAEQSRPVVPAPSAPGKVIE